MFFPSCSNRSDFIAKVVKEEEEAFLRTLDKGLKKIDDVMRSATGMIPGAAVFEL